ncbi:hypothetical protein SO694_00180041 [Aureococcus anophagefferens]|uniref:Uncharacterized protein n=1 Tax=Aureococcus anophagefferens TaxID=44056 RepID=A0ABR1FGE2_AURAN
MRAATLRLLATAALAARADAALPAALAKASSVLKSGRVLAQLRTFFASGGPGSRFRIGLELGCVEGGQRLGTAASRQWRKPADHDLLDSKWGLESSLPLMVASSPWFARPGERANASLVVFRPRAHASDLSRCRAAVDPRNDRTDLWPSPPRAASPAFLSPAYRPPFADVLDWPAFSATLRRDDVGTLRDALAKLDHAALHANLLKVRDLFAFHVDAGARRRALPLAVFEMWRRARARARGRPLRGPRRPAGRRRGPRRRGRRARARARAARADVAYACAGDGESCAYSRAGRRRGCSTRTPMACGTIKPETPEDVLLTFVGELASNDDFDIDTQDRMNSVGLFPNHMLDAEMFEGYIDNVPRLQELIDGADIEVCIGFMQRFQPQITSMASLLAFYHACLMREPRGSHAKIITYQRFWVSRGHGPGAAVSRTK